jgi:hypothetical protein
MVELFISIIQTVDNVFLMRYVVMIVAQQTQVGQMVSSLTYMSIILPQVRIISNIRQLYDV